MSRKSRVQLQRPRLTAVMIPTEQLGQADQREMVVAVGQAHGWATVPAPVERGRRIALEDGAPVKVRHCWWSDRRGSHVIEFEYAKEKPRDVS
jgi:hypothetical protein